MLINKLELVQAALEIQTALLADKQVELGNVEIDIDIVEASFIELLDDGGQVDVAGLMLTPSRVWQEMDPTAFRCAVSDHADSFEVSNTEEYQEVETEIEEIEALIETLEVEIEEVEQEIEESEED